MARYGAIGGPHQRAQRREPEQRLPAPVTQQPEQSNGRIAPAPVPAIRRTQIRLLRRLIQDRLWQPVGALLAGGSDQRAGLVTTKHPFHPAAAKAAFAVPQQNPPFAEMLRWLRAFSQPFITHGHLALSIDWKRWSPLPYGGGMSQVGTGGIGGRRWGYRVFNALSQELLQSAFIGENMRRNYGIFFLDVATREIFQVRDAPFAKKVY